jgi:hypothetical protein
MTVLIVGTVFALGALVYVLWPLVAADGKHVTVATPSPAPDATDDNPIDALRDIEFDHATGKLSESDYATLKAQYTHDAVEELRRARSADAIDPAEEAVRRIRQQTRRCPTCGPRPEPGARYCSSCGAALG